MYKLRLPKREFRSLLPIHTLFDSYLSTPNLTMASESCWERTSVRSSLSRPLRIARYTGVVTLSSFPEAVETASCYKIYGNVKFFACTLYTKDFLRWDWIVLVHYRWMKTLQMQWNSLLNINQRMHVHVFWAE